MIPRLRGPAASGPATAGGAMLGPARGRTRHRRAVRRWPEPATPPVPHPSPSPRWPLGSPEGCCPGLRSPPGECVVSAPRMPRNTRLRPRARAPAPCGAPQGRGSTAEPPLALGLYGPRRLRQPAHRDWNSYALTFPELAAALRRLDQREGFRPDGPRHYDRILVEAHPLAGGEPVRAWCYVYAPSRLQGIAGASPLGGGDWAAAARRP